MARQAGLVIQGDDAANDLVVTVVHEGNDLYIYNVIHAAGGDDALSGRAASDDWAIIHHYGTQLFGEDGDDTLLDSEVADTLSGGGGDDTIHYTDGNDDIDGGDGFDTLILDNSYPTLDQFKSTGIEQLLVPGGEVYVGNFDLNTVDIIGPDSTHYARTLIFSKRADVTDVTFIGTHTWSLVCSKFADVIDVSASSTNFSLSGGIGDDRLMSGRGNDTLSGARGNDTLSGGEGNDILFGEAGNDTLLGGDGDDHIFTSIGDDVVNGGGGDDVISGKIGTSSGWATRTQDFKIINGGAGNDIFRDFRLYDGTASHFLGGEGTDEIVLGADISKLTLKDIEILRVAGSHFVTASADVLNSFDQIVGIEREHFRFNLSSGGRFTWNAASQEPHLGTIAGSSQADYIDMSASRSIWTVLGGDGNDTLKAGGGYNSLSGQAGRDTFIFDDNTGRTEIVDYDHSGADSDIIDLSAVSSIKDFNDMMENHVQMSDKGDWLTIQLGKGDIELHHVTKTDLAEAGFVF